MLEVEKSTDRELTLSIHKVRGWVMLCLRPRLHYTGLHRSVAIFIPDLAAVYTTPQ